MSDELFQSLLPRLDATEEAVTDFMSRALKIARKHLGMEIAYASEFVGDCSVFRAVDAPQKEHLIKPGDAYPLDQVYCLQILQGLIPAVMRDTSEIAAAAKMPITKAVPIGSHMSVPIRLEDGEIYGMFCCFKSDPDQSLNDRDLRVMRAFAELVGVQIYSKRDQSRQREAKHTRVTEAIKGNLSIVYQPIQRLSDNQIVGYEALSRFGGPVYRSPDVWFKDAFDVGLGVELELAAIRKALADFAHIPRNVYLTVNASPETILSPDFLSIFEQFPNQAIVIELTEHIVVQSYVDLCARLRDARRQRIRFAVDDAGAGYASFRHILDLKPEFIKLDMTLTRDIDSDPARRALATALIHFAQQTGSEIIAEGVETKAELRTLQALGVEKAQGYLIGRPAPLVDILARPALIVGAASRNGIGPASPSASPSTSPA